jgi:putative membrane-bound dehydrogenase-like protein
MRRSVLAGLWLWLVSVLLVGSPWAAFAADAVIPRNQDVPPGPALSPAEALAKMVVPEGFQVELVASEPDLVNPVSMCIDEKGRVWVTESLEYPRREPGKGRDRVKVLEDTNGDGKVDKTTVFLDELNIPSGIAVGHGGVWIANAPDILFARDTDGDLKADTVETVVTGFGRDDTHELPNAFTWGPDGWLYGLNGVFNFSHVKYSPENPNYKQDHPGWPLTVALWRINPRTREFQIYAEGTSNPWGIAINEEGSFFLSACVIDHLWHIVENGYYHRQAGAYPPHTWKIESIVKHKHQKAAYCGITWFDSPAFPERYNRTLYMGNIHGNCVNADKIERQGATYFGTGEPDFLVANDAWFMPVAQKVAPDGSLYVLDWYDQYHCYQDANRDPAGIERAKGRLYRVRYKAAKRFPVEDLGRKSDDELLALLGDPNVHIRETAQRLLSERNTPAIVAKLRARVAMDFQPPVHRAHAAFALASCDLRTHKEGDKICREMIEHKDPVVAQTGLKALRSHLVRSPVDDLVAMWISECVIPRLEEKETPASVRLEAAITVSRIAEQQGGSSVSYGDSLGQSLTHLPNDPVYARIVWKALRELMRWHPHEGAILLETPGVVATAAGKELLPRIVEYTLTGPKFDPLGAAAIYEAVTKADGAAPELAARLLGQLAAKVQTGEIAGERLAELKQAFAPLVAARIAAGAADPQSLDAALLAASWKDTAGLAALRSLIVAAGTSPERILQAVAALVAAGDVEVLPPISKVLGLRDRYSVDLRAKVLAALGKLDHANVATVVLNAYPQSEPELQPQIVELLTSRASWGKALLKAIAEKQVAANALNENQVRKLLASKDDDLRKLVVAQWGSVREERNPAREQVIAAMRTHLRKTPGDPFKGQEVFKKVCGQCHKIYGEGQEVGPDITLNGRNSFEQLLSNVFDPSLVIGASYQAQVVQTTDGRTLTGLLAEDSPQRIVLKVQGGKQEIIPRDQVEDSGVSKVSLMPEALETQITRQELADLFAFITLDKPPSDPTARRLAGAGVVVPKQTENPQEFAELVAQVAPGFACEASGEGGLAILEEHFGRVGVLRSHPVDRQKPTVFKRQLAVPAGKKTRLELDVSHDAQGDWQLRVRVNDRFALDEAIGEATTTAHWKTVTVDLTRYAGQTVTIELWNQATGWSYEFGYWGRVDLISE